MASRPAALALLTSVAGALLWLPSAQAATREAADPAAAPAPPPVVAPALAAPATPGPAAPHPPRASAAAPQAPPAAGTGKTIVLGFDGMDHALTRRFIDEGLLPNLKRLSEQGVFQPLMPSNPAQSNVAWAVFNTGQNPGKTGLEGFVGRKFNRDTDGNRVGQPLPRLMLGDPEHIPAEAFVTFPQALEAPLGFALGAGAVALVVVTLLLRVLLRLKLVIAAIVGLLAGGGGFYLGMGYAHDLPADGQVPYESNPMQGTNFWTHLDGRGVRLTGVAVASAYPLEDEGANTRILSGLGVKDIAGGPGTWFVFTDDPWSFADSLPGGGDLKKISFDQSDASGRPDRRATVALPGPDDWVAEARFTKELEALEARIGHRDNTAEETAEYERVLADVKKEYDRWRRSDRATSFDFTVDVDREGKTLAFDVGGRRFTLGVGEWSDYVPVTFRFNSQFAAHGIVKFHVLRIDEEEVRIFCPPVNIDPYQPPEYLPISAPPGFSRQIAEGIGDHYSTLGWACMTNPLKAPDAHFPAQSFLDDIVAIGAGCEQILAWSLAQADTWDVYYQLFSTTDRLCHMLMREFDEGHPKHDPAYAATMVEAWGRRFALKDAVREIYKETDRIVGGVMARIEAGEFGDDCWLMLVADHGFNSFRRGVNLNNLLAEKGWLVTKDGKPIEEHSKSDLLQFVDWSKSKAYSLGLGQVYVNLKGREPFGIVEPKDYDVVVEGIRDDLLSVTDGPGGPQVLSNVWRRDEIFSGPWVVEGKATRRMYGQVEEIEHDGFADLVMGFAPTYRVSWDNTLGGVDEAAIVDSSQHWSGDHVSVDPSHVQGIFFCNRKLERPTPSGLIDIGPTLLARYGIDVSTTDVDGQVLPLAGLPR